MSFLEQLRTAIRGQIEDFFRVKWPAVAVMIVVIALLIFGVYWRTSLAMSGHSHQFWVVRGLINVSVLALLFGARRFFKR